MTKRHEDSPYLQAFGSCCLRSGASGRHVGLPALLTQDVETSRRSPVTKAAASDTTPAAHQRQWRVRESLDYVANFMVGGMQVAVRQPCFEHGEHGG